MATMSLSAFHLAGSQLAPPGLSQMQSIDVTALGRCTLTACHNTSRPVSTVQLCGAAPSDQLNGREWQKRAVPPSW